MEQDKKPYTYETYIEPEPFKRSPLPLIIGILLAFSLAWWVLNSFVEETTKSPGANISQILIGQAAEGESNFVLVGKRNSDERILVDCETGIQYLVTAGWNGGMTPRLSKDGKYLLGKC